jgi:signal transduction histidine kinase
VHRRLERIAALTIHGHGYAEADRAARTDHGSPASVGSNLQRAQEEDRARIAQTIHDHFGFLLTLLRMRLQSVKEHLNRLSDDEETLASKDAALAELSAAEDAWQQLSDAARQLQNDLRPAPLDTLGLAAAFAALQKTFAGAGLTVAFNVEPILGKRFGAGLETTAYWLTQHSLTNALRHSGTDQATVTADIVQTRGHEMLHIVIEDRGKGFAVGPIGSTFGLTAMYDRAALVGGTVVTDSAPGHGARVVIDLPTDFGTSDGERHSELAERG